ncbi:hypothetical protein AVEN_101692-1 [Araneus ventricosus]|uniref:Uncharacterized protein n=1 Tax=Araneus ventricosus TaxID=182803 RepID=A0A4Y2TDF3_ARAVE|nr:hypothetical protein AVEN_207500-1 [Araneus ventricosus]GBN98698.1 hypothetical protein AVEN_101692-1 [Araneus ventricosus]
MHPASKIHFSCKVISQEVVLYSLNNFNFVLVIGIPNNTEIFQIGSDMSAVQNLQGKFAGKFSGSALKNSKHGICLRDHGINALGKIKFSVKDDPKIRDYI